MQMVEEEVNNIDMMGLSAREMEIIDLVADGLTNQEIAVKLTISKRTVDNHVSNMFTKTGSKVITAELMPPRGGSPIRSLKIAQLLKDKVHAVNITDGSRAVMRMCSLAMSKLCLLYTSPSPRD